VLTPLEVGLTIMRDLFRDSVDPDTGRIVNRDTAKQAATIAADWAPYIHPRLAATQVSGPDDGPITIERIVSEIIDPRCDDTEKGS